MIPGCTVLGPSCYGVAASGTACGSQRLLPGACLGRTFGIRGVGQDGIGTHPGHLGKMAELGISWG